MFGRVCCSIGQKANFVLLGPPRGRPPQIPLINIIKNMIIIQPNSNWPLTVQHQGVTPHNNNFVTQHNSSEGRYARERTDTEDVKIEFRNSEFAIS